MATQEFTYIKGYQFDGTNVIWPSEQKYVEYCPFKPPSVINLKIPNSFSIDFDMENKLTITGPFLWLGCPMQILDNDKNTGAGMVFSALYYLMNYGHLDLKTYQSKVDDFYIKLLVAAGEDKIQIELLSKNMLAYEKDGFPCVEPLKVTKTN